MLRRRRREPTRAHAGAVPRGLARCLPLLLAALAIALVGCIRAEIAIKVNEDGSGAVTVLAAFDQDAFESLADDFGDGATPELPSFDDLAATDLPEGVSIEEYDEDGFTGVRSTFPFAATDDIASVVDEVLSDADSDGTFGADSAFESFELRREGEGWRFEATAAPLNDALDGAEALGLGGAIFDLLFDDASFEIKVELPGDVIEHNADRMDGNTLVWELELTGSEPRQLLAVTGVGEGGGGFNVVAALLVFAVLIVAVGGVVWFWSQTRSASGGV